MYQSRKYNQKDNQKQLLIKIYEMYQVSKNYIIKIVPVKKLLIDYYKTINNINMVKLEIIKVKNQRDLIICKRIRQRIYNYKKINLFSIEIHHHRKIIENYNKNLQIKTLNKIKKKLEHKM